MTLQTPLWMQAATGDSAVSYSAANYRYGLLSALFTKTGVIDPINSGGLQVVQHAAGANMSVDVNAGTAIIPGTDVSLQGNYFCANDAGGVNLTVPAAPASGTRVHRVVAQVQDRLNNAGYAANTYQWVLSLLADTGSGTPATPASAISLATVSVSAGQSSVTNANITDTRTWAQQAITTEGILTVASGVSAADATRTPRYKLTADGYVFLYGWVNATAGGSLTAGTTSPLLTGLPANATPSGIRDCIMATSKGAVDCVINSSGVISWQPLTGTIATFVGDWWSFEGISYRVAS